MLKRFREWYAVFGADVVPDDKQTEGEVQGLFTTYNA